jgi:hypothetical protein
VSALQLTIFAKTGGPLTKRISLAEDGSLKSDGSACVMSRGTARRFGFEHVEQLASLIEQLGPHEAIALGGLRGDLPDRVDVTTKRKLNGAERPNIIARTPDYLVYQPGKSAVALIDYDTKGMPATVAATIEERGGLWPALVSALPTLSGVARVERRSTSAGLYRTDTRQLLPGSGGLHVFLVVEDGADAERFLNTLHARCWLAGLAWMMVGAGGQLLERSIVDRVVGSPERLVFEGPPVLDPPLAQDRETRRCRSHKGEPLDTVSACPPLTILELAKLRELRAKEAVRLAADAARAREAFIDRQSRRLAERTGTDLTRARRTVERQCAGVLLPDVALPFDDEELGGKTVADVLADPARFEGATLADPLEGVDYGIGKAKIMLRADGRPWINSFAHGRTVYELRLDARSAQAALQKAPRDEAAETFVRLALAADLDDDEIEALRNLAHDRSGITRRALDRKLSHARREEAARRVQQERERRLAERQDPRPLIPVPELDEVWLPLMSLLNDVLGQAGQLVPPIRNADGLSAQVRMSRLPSLHLLTRRESN